MPGENATNENCLNQNLEWAAYVVGRHPQAIRVWQITVWQIAHADPSCQPSPWNIYCRSCRRPPFELFEELDAALVELAAARLVDAGLLVELHRQLDQIRTACGHYAEMFEEDDREGIADEFTWEYDRWEIVEKLIRELIEKNEDCRKWAALGREIGEWLVKVYDFGHPPSFPSLEQLQQRIDSEPLQDRLGQLVTFSRELWDIKQERYNVDESIYQGEWEHRITAFDQAILEVLNAGVATAACRNRRNPKGIGVPGRAVSIRRVSGERRRGINLFPCLDGGTDDADHLR